MCRLALTGESLQTFGEFFSALRQLFQPKGAQPAAKAKPRRSRPKRPPAVLISKRWHAVTIEPRHQACEAAFKAAGVRYLSSEAPPLPLAGCDAVECKCRYRHYRDRRADDPIGIEPKDLLSQPMRRDTD